VRDAKKEELEDKLLFAALPSCSSQLALLARHLATDFAAQLSSQQVWGRPIGF
jgi:hypothetical protein